MTRRVYDRNPVVQNLRRWQYLSSIDAGVPEKKAEDGRALGLTAVKCKCLKTGQWYKHRSFDKGAVDGQRKVE